jgi:anti-sigma-K factor RskA
MMDERLEEQAALHVLGALTPAEAREFKQKLHADPELQAYVARLSTATSAVAGAVPVVEPPPQLRSKILARVEPLQKTVSLPERKFKLAWLPWSLATLFAALYIFTNAQDSRFRETAAQQAQQIAQQTQQIKSLNDLAQALQSTTNSLQQTVVALQETNRLANLRIAMLTSALTNSPNTVAVSLWDDSKQNGVFVAQNLKALPADRDYQLWVLDNGTKPVSAGVFTVHADGTARADFKAAQLIEVAGKFAVTEEPKGGLPAPTLKNLVLIGG